MSDGAPIVAVTGHRRWDSRGLPTVEVVVETTRGRGRALAPAGASTGSAEAVDLRDGGPAFGGKDVTRALASVHEVIAPALAGHDALDLDGADAVLERLDPRPDFATIGGNAVVATSMAVAAAAAVAADRPLWALLDPEARRIPTPEIQIFGGGAHAEGRIDLQDLLVVPFGAASFGQALDWVAEIHRQGGEWLRLRGRRGGVADEGGWWPAFDSNEQALEALLWAIEATGLRPGVEVGIALDVAATQLVADGGYRLSREGVTLSREQWCERLVGWTRDFPIVSVEDAFAEDDAEGMAMLVSAVGDRVQLVGDDFLVTDARRVREAAGAATVNAVLVKPNQAGTLARARAALEAARDHGFTAIVSARSGETEDVTIAHLAVGWGSDGFKVGSMTRGERTAKWNEMLRIEESLGAAARFAGADALAIR